MSQKPPERSEDETGDEGPGTQGSGAMDRGGARKPVVPRGLGLAGDTVRPPQPVVSFGEPEPLPEFVQDRETLPPPVPMEQLVEQMMQPDMELEEARRSSAETIPPPASDVDTVRPRGDDARTIPPRDDDTILQRVHDAKTIPPRGDDSEPPRRDDAKTMPPRGEDTDPPRQDDLATLPPPQNDADTLPGVANNLLEEHEPLYRGIAARESSSSLTARALDTAEAVFEELGVELFRARDTIETEPPPRSRPMEEPPRSRPVEEPPRSRPVEEPPRSRPADESMRGRVPEEPPRPRAIEERPRLSSRLTPPRTVRPTNDAPPPPPPSSTAGRPGSHRRRPSETGARSSESLISSERPLSSAPGVPVSERLNEVRARYEAGDHRAALALAESILTDAPNHIAALSYAESSRQMLKQKYMARIGDTSLVPRLKAGVEEIARHGLDERGRRVLASIDGVLSIDDIIGAAGLPTIEVLRVLHDLLVAHRIDLGTFSRGRR